MEGQRQLLADSGGGGAGGHTPINRMSNNGPTINIENNSASLNPVIPPGIPDGRRVGTGERMRMRVNREPSMRMRVARPGMDEPANINPDVPPDGGGERIGVGDAINNPPEEEMANINPDVPPDDGGERLAGEDEADAFIREQQRQLAKLGGSDKSSAVSDSASTRRTLRPDSEVTGSRTATTQARSYRQAPELPGDEEMGDVPRPSGEEPILESNLSKSAGPITSETGGLRPVASSSAGVRPISAESGGLRPVAADRIAARGAAPITRGVEGLRPSSLSWNPEPMDPAGRARQVDQMMGRFRPGMGGDQYNYYERGMGNYGMRPLSRGTLGANGAEIPPIQRGLTTQTYMTQSKTPSYSSQSVPQTEAAGMPQEASWGDTEAAEAGAAEGVAAEGAEAAVGSELADLAIIAL